MWGKTRALGGAPDGGCMQSCEWVGGTRLEAGSCSLRMSNEASRAAACGVLMMA